MHSHRFTPASFHSIKQRVLPLSAVTVSLHHLPKMSEDKSHAEKRINYRNLK